MEIKEIRESLIKSAETLKAACGTYKLENNCAVAGLGYGDALAKFVGHLATDLKLDIRYEKASDLLDSDERVQVIVFDSNPVIDRISNKNVIAIERKGNVIDDFMCALLGLEKAAFALSEKGKTEEIDEYVSSYSKDELEKIAEEAERAVGKADVKEIDYIGEGYEETLIDFARMFNQQNSGVFSSYENSEDYHHINVFLRNPETLYTPMIVNSNANSVVRLTETLVVNDAIERKMAVICDDENLNTVSSKIIVKKAEKPYIASIIEGYVYLYLTALMSKEI